MADSQNIMSCITSADYHIFHKIWLDENCGSSRSLLNITSDILQSALNDSKLNSKNQTLKVPYICSSWDCEYHIFISFALRSTCSRYCPFYITIDSHIKISKYHKTFKSCLIAKKSTSLYSSMVANVLIKFGSSTVGGVVFFFFKLFISIWSCVNKKFKVP